MILPGHTMMVGKSGAGYLPIPPMTSNTTPAGFVVSASTEGVGPAWQAFDQAGPTTFWQTATGGANNSWLQFEAPVQFEVIAFDSQVGATAGRAPRTFNFLGSNDGVSFDPLLSVVNAPSWVANETRRYTLASIGLYKIYRLETILSWDSSLLRIGEITFLQNGDI